MAKFVYPVISWILNIPAMFVDGALYVFIGLFGVWAAFFGSDEAEKWIQPETLFWIKFSILTGGSMVANLKMFRSSTYADHLKQKVSKNEKANLNLGPIGGDGK